MDWLEEVRKGDAGNFQVSVQQLGTAIALVHDVSDLYEWIGHAMEPDSQAPDAEVVAANLLRVAHYHLIQGVLDCLRGHLSDSFGHTRLAIEAAAFSARVRRAPDTARLWLGAHDSEDAYRRYRRSFGAEDIFPRNDALLTDLRGRYDTCARQTHPSLYRASSHVRFDRDDGVGEFQFFQVSSDDPSEPARTFLYILTTHFLLIRVFQGVFAKVVQRDQRAWDVQRSAVDARLTLEYQRWEPIIRVNVDE